MGGGNNNNPSTTTNDSSARAGSYSYIDTLYDTPTGGKASETDPSTKKGSSPTSEANAMNSYEEQMKRFAAVVADPSTNNSHNNNSMDDTTAGSYSYLDTTTGSNAPLDVPPTINGSSAATATSEKEYTSRSSSSSYRDTTGRPPSPENTSLSKSQSDDTDVTNTILLLSTKSGVSMNDSSATVGSYSYIDALYDTPEEGGVPVVVPSTRNDSSAPSGAMTGYEQQMKRFAPVVADLPSKNDSLDPSGSYSYLDTTTRDNAPVDVPPPINGLATTATSKTGYTSSSSSSRYSYLDTTARHPPPENSSSTDDMDITNTIPSHYGSSATSGAGMTSYIDTTGGTVTAFSRRNNNVPATSSGGGPHSSPGGEAVDERKSAPPPPSSSSSSSSSSGEPSELFSYLNLQPPAVGGSTATPGGVDDRKPVSSRGEVSGFSYLNNNIEPSTPSSGSVLTPGEGDDDGGGELSKFSYLKNLPHQTSVL